MSFEIIAISSVAAALGVAHILIGTPIFESATEDGENSGDLAPIDQERGELSEIELFDDEDDGVV